MPNCLLIPFSNIKRSILTNLEKALDKFIADHLFQILSKVYLQTLKKPVQFFAYHLLQILKKVCLQILKKHLAQYCADQLFQILKKADIQILKKPGQIFY